MKQCNETGVQCNSAARQQSVQEAVLQAGTEQEAVLQALSRAVMQALRNRAVSEAIRIVRVQGQWHCCCCCCCCCCLEYENSCSVRIEKSAGARASGRGLMHHGTVDFGDFQVIFGFRSRTDSLHSFASEARDDG